MKNADKPARPFIPPMPRNDEAQHGFSGLTKREYFAAMAMQGLISQSSEEVRLDTALEIPSNTAKWAVRFADELLKQLEA